MLMKIFQKPFDTIFKNEYNAIKLIEKRRVIVYGSVENFRLVKESMKYRMNMVLELHNRKVGYDGITRYRDRV